MPVMRYAAAAAAAMLTAQPCAAADDFRERRNVETRSGAFAGLALRVPLDEGRSQRPQARLQFTGVSNVREAGGATTTRYAPGVELGAGRRGVLVSVAGRDVREMEERLGVGGSTGTALLIVGGVVLIVFVLAALADGPTAGPPEGAFD